MIVHLFMLNGEADRVLVASTRFCPRVEALNSREVFCVPATAEHGRELFVTLAREGYRVLAGAGRSCLVARLASLTLRRPHLPRRALKIDPAPVGPLASVSEGREAFFLAPLPVGLLWPAPPRLRAELTAHGLFTIGDVARVPVALLSQRFGMWGHLLAAYARGEDYRAVRPGSPPREISRRWQGEIHDLEALEAAVKSVARSLAAALTARGQACRKLRLELEPVDGPTVTATRCYRTPQAASATLAARLLALAAPAARSPLAGLGATAEELVPLKAEQLCLPVAREAGTAGVGHPPEPPLVRPASIPGQAGQTRPEAARVLAWLRSRYPDLTTAARLSRSRREEMLYFYDPRRSAGGTEGLWCPGSFTGPSK